MTQPVSIYGRSFVLQKLGGDRMYSVIEPASGAVVAQHERRFMALAQAAQLVRSAS